jgi:hypothetical protein
MNYECITKAKLTSFPYHAVFEGGNFFYTKRKPRGAMAPLGPEYYSTVNGTRKFLPQHAVAISVEDYQREEALARKSAEYTAAFAQGAPAAGPAEADAPKGDPAIFMAG